MGEPVWYCIVMTVSWGAMEAIEPNFCPGQELNTWPHV